MKIFKQLTANKMKKLDQYSKCVVNAMIEVWFKVVIFGAVIIVAESVMAFCFPTYGIIIHLPEYMNFVGRPMELGIVMYMAKAAFENREKIKQNPNYDEYSGG